MNKGLFLSLIFVILGVALVRAKDDDDFECFSCIHINALAEEEHDDLEIQYLKGHKTCEIGKVPDPKFKVVCGEVQVDGKDVPTVCMTFSSSSGTLGGAKTDFTVRGCMHSNANLNSGRCEKRTLANVTAAAVGAMRVNLSGVGGSLNAMDAEGDFCVCDAENCNPAGRSSAFSKLTLFVSATVVMFVSWMK